MCFAAVFCSDLQRSWETAELAFGARGVPIVRDPRLRECDYGNLTRHSAEAIEREKPRRLREPFPNGESYEEATARVNAFLDVLRAAYAGRRVLVVGHRATQYGLERWLVGVPLAEAVTAPWSWQPGWAYEVEPAPNEAATLAGS